jgi:PhnB protein
MPVRPVPEGYHTATAHIVVGDAARAIEFYVRAFGARELMRMPAPGGRIGHAEIMIGDSRIMLCDEFPEMGARSPRALGGSPVSIYLYVDDADRVAKQAIEAGAKEIRPVEDKFYGDRSGTIEDPFGHTWHVSTHKEDVPPEELQRRVQNMMKERPPAA